VRRVELEDRGGSTAVLAVEEGDVPILPADCTDGSGDTDGTGGALSTVRVDGVVESISGGIVGVGNNGEGTGDTTEPSTASAGRGTEDVGILDRGEEDESGLVGGAIPDLVGKGGIRDTAAIDNVASLGSDVGLEGDSDVHRGFQSAGIAGTTDHITVIVGGDDDGSREDGKLGGGFITSETAGLESVVEVLLVGHLLTVAGRGGGVCTGPGLESASTDNVASAVAVDGTSSVGVAVRDGAVSALLSEDQVEYEGIADSGCTARSRDEDNSGIGSAKSASVSVSDAVII